MDPMPQYGAYAFIPYMTDSISNAEPPDPPSFGIKRTSTWTYCGPLLEPTPLPPSLQHWSTHTTTSPSALLQRLLPLLTFLHDFLSQAGAQYYWFTLRATKPTTDYDMPRWHVDDDFFSLTSTPQSGRKGTTKRGNADWKLCTTLLGPSTLFLPLSSNASALKALRNTKKMESAKRGPHTCLSIRCAGCFDTGEAVRSNLAVELAGEEVVQFKFGEAAFFRIGEEEGAVHSEPPCHVDRVFVNVVPGTEQNLRKLMSRYGMDFPRAWSLGLPLGIDSSADEAEEFRYGSRE